MRWAYLGASVRKMRKVENRLKRVATRLNTAKTLQVIAETLRGPYINYIGMLDLQNNSTNWWFSTLSEKNPTISKAFLHICYLAVAADLCREHGGHGILLLVVEDVGVRQAVMLHLQEKGIHIREIHESYVARISSAVCDWGQMLVRRVYGLGSNIWRLIVARSMGFSASVGNGMISENDPWVLLFNWIDDRSFDAAGRYRDVYFDRLREELQKRGFAVAVVARVLTRSSYWRSLARLKQSGIRVLVPEAALTFGALWRWARTLPFRPPQRHAWARFEPPEAPDMKFDVSAILNEAERIDWINTRAAEVRLITDVVWHWSRRFPVQALIYPYEGQSWERGYCLAMREWYPRARLIGYQHATVSSMWLSHFIAKDERGRVPLPDRLVTNGHHPYELLRKNGVPDSILVRGTALRYGENRTSSMSEASRVPFPRSTLHVLVTPSVIRTQAAELLLAVLKVFTNPNLFRVTFKPHPGIPVAHVLSEAGIRSLPQHVTVSMESVPALLRDADVLIYTDSTTAVEAIDHGVPIVHFKSNHEIDTDPLIAFEKVRESVETPEGLLQAARAAVIADHKERDMRAGRWRSAIDLLLPPLDDKTIDLFVPDSLQRGIAGIEKVTTSVSEEGK